MADLASFPVRPTPEVVVPSAVALVLVAVVDEIVPRELPEDQVGVEGFAKILVEHELLQRPEPVDRRWEDVDEEVAFPESSLQPMDVNVSVGNLVRLGD